MRTIAVINQKGGSGKTTSAINLAAVLAKRGGKTLLVDVDPQSHCALGLAVPESQIELTVGDAMLAPDDRPLDLTRLLWPVNKSLDLMPSATRLAGLEAARGGLADREDRDLRLASVLRRFEGTYDWVVIDCPPSIGLLTFNALRASTEILVPVETGYFALRGAAKQVQTIRSLCRRFGQAPPYRVLATMHDESSTLSCEVLADLGKKFEDCVLPVTIRFDVRLKEAASMGVPVVEYAPRSSGAQDYSALASYLAENVPVPLRLDPLQPGESPDAHDTSVGRGRAVVAIDLFSPESGSSPAPRTAPVPALAAAHALAAASGHDSRHADAGFFRADPASPDAATSPVSRAAELAARARRILQKSEELTHRIAADPAISRAAAAAAAPAHAEPKPTPSHDSTLRLLTSSAPAHTHAPQPPAVEIVLGVRQTPQGVLFLYPLALGPKVCIAGDHNNWSGDATPMRFNPVTGLHEACLDLPPGRFKYRLVIAGRWVADPFNPITEPNPFGDTDSVFDVQPIPARTPPQAISDPGHDALPHAPHAVVMTPVTAALTPSALNPQAR